MRSESLVQTRYIPDISLTQKDFVTWKPSNSGMHSLYATWNEIFTFHQNNSETINAQNGMVESLAYIWKPTLST